MNALGVKLHSQLPITFVESKHVKPVLPGVGVSQNRAWQITGQVSP